MADLVVDASGRRCIVDPWLSEIGANRPQTLSAECGAAYYSRHYRVRPGSQSPSPEYQFFLGLHSYFTVIMVASDQDTRSITLAPLVQDAPMRRLRNPTTHSTVGRLIAPVAAWLDAMDPITEVHVMGGLHNTLRRFVVDGRPVVLGLHAVGDAICTTNPVGGRGISLAFRSAADLTDVLASYPDDAWAQAIMMDDAVAWNISPWYDAQIRGDSERLSAIRRALHGEPPASLPDIANGVTFNHLRAAAMIDPELFRALSAVQTMARTPVDVLAEVEGQVRAAFAAGNVAPPPAGPSRVDILDALQAAH